MQPAKAPAIREAVPQDADFLAWVMLTAARSHLGRGWFDIALNQSEDRCLEFLRALATTTVPSWWHYSRFLVAEVEGVKAAALCAFPAAEAYPLSQAAMSEAAEALRIPAAEQAAIWRRGAYIFSCTMAGGENGWTLENIATLSAYRRRGLTTALIMRSIERGRARGFAEAQITYLIGNDTAERAYRQAGFQLAGECRHPDFEAAAGAAGLRRVVRRL